MPKRARIHKVPFHYSCDLVRGNPLTPEATAKAKAGKAMQRKNRIKFIKMSFTENEYKFLTNKLSTFEQKKHARFLREKILKDFDFKSELEPIVIEDKKPDFFYSKLDREFLLELSRIGNNLNQIAKTLNADILKNNNFDSMRLLTLLISVSEQIENLSESVK